MAGLDSIKQKILDDAQTRADAIIAEAEAEADAIVQKAMEEAGKNREKRLAYAQTEAVKARERVIGSAKMEAKKILLAEKQKLMDQCFEKAKQEIINMPLSDYEELMVELIVASSEEGDEEIIFNTRDSGRISLLRFLVRVNSKLKADGVKAPRMLISEDNINASGGFLLKKGDIVVNNTIEALLAAKREQLEVELAAILFQ